MKTRLLLNLGTIPTVLVTVLLLSSCGGFFPSADTIVALSVSPTGAFIKPTATQQYTATATFGNNTMGDATDKVTWLSSDTSKATIDTSGLATAVALGTTTITAKSGSVTATSLLTVSNKTVTSLTINTSTTTISLSQSQTAQFTAMASYSDGSNGDVTNQASWTSSVQSVATINSNGVASPVSVGSTSIGATYGGQTASPITLTVTQ